MNTLQKIKYWNKWHATSMLMVLSVFLFLENSGRVSSFFNGVLSVAAISFLTFFYQHFSDLKKLKPFGGYANWVTSFRLALIFLVGFAYQNFPVGLLLFLIILIACLDGVDGFLARKFKQQSDFGAYLDMETDTFYVCVLCCMHFAEGKFGAWILVIGALRYGYVGAIYLFQLQHKKEPHTRFAQTIAVILFIALMTPVVFQQRFYIPMVVMASILVSWSFGRSFWGLLTASDGS